MKSLMWTAFIIMGAVLVGVWAAWPNKVGPTPPRMPERPLVAASFPAATPAEVKRLTDPAQLNRLSGALGEAEPLNHRQLPARPEDDLLCIFMEGDSGNGPCLRLWIQENLLQSPAGLYTPPQGFAGLLADLRKNAFVTCDETPAQDRWPEDYGLARGEGEIWLVDSGGAHEAGAQRKVGWRVVRAAGRLVVKARRLDGTDTFEMAITQRVAPNGRDQYPMYWDAVSYLTFPSAGCWELTLQAGERTERITLNVR